MTNDFPAINLDPASTPWAKAAQQRILNLERSVTRFEQSIQNSVNSISSVGNVLSSQVQTLNAVANVQYQKWTNATGVTGIHGFYGTTTASVQVASPTGRLEVGFGGSLNSGNGYFCYSITGATSGVVVDRNTVFADYAQRVAVSGGASFTPSAFNTVIIPVPVNDVLTVKSELYSSDGFAYFFGASILARVAP